MFKVIPLKSENQSFTCTLPVDGKNITLGFDIRYNSEGKYWWMSISDADGNTILDSIPLLKGSYPAANLLGQYSYLNIGSAFVIEIGEKLSVLNDTNLGTDFVLVWGDTYVS